MSAGKWIAKLIGSFGYRYFRMPWDIGPHEELVALVENGRVKPGCAIDLGSGTASNCIILTQHGLDISGVDFANKRLNSDKRDPAFIGSVVENDQ